MIERVTVNVDKKLILYIERDDILYAACVGIDVGFVDVEKWSVGIIHHRTNFGIADLFHYDEQYVIDHLSKLTKQCTKVKPLLEVEGYEDCGCLRRHCGYLGVTVIRGERDFTITSRIQGAFAAMAEIWHLSRYLPFTVDVGIV